jgi:hypothetical protein
MRTAVGDWAGDTSRDGRRVQGRPALLTSAYALVEVETRDCQEDPN